MIAKSSRGKLDAQCGQMAQLQQWYTAGMKTRLAELLKSQSKVVITDDTAGSYTNNKLKQHMATCTNARTTRHDDLYKCTVIVQRQTMTYTSHSHAHIRTFTCPIKIILARMEPHRQSVLFTLMRANVRFFSHCGERELWLCVHWRCFPTENFSAQEMNFLSADIQDHLQKQVSIVPHHNRERGFNYM